jgi:exo-beta-1,3-glucanase (GH17 family)
MGSATIASQLVKVQLRLKALHPLQHRISTSSSTIDDYTRSSATNGMQPVRQLQQSKDSICKNSEQLQNNYVMMTSQLHYLLCQLIFLLVRA